MVNNKQASPNFIGVGSQRAGTTWLYNCLKEHPQIFLTKKKELHFFDLNFNYNYEDYLHHFDTEEARQAKAIGEITPNYYQYPQALDRIAEFDSEIKIIYIVRNPIERAFSHYQLFSDNHFKGKSFSEIIRENKNIIDLGLQAKHLSKMKSLFKFQNILVLTYDDLCQNPDLFIRKVFNFLEVDESFTPTKLNKRINRVVLPRAQLFFTAIKMNWFIQWCKKSVFAEKIKNMAKPKKANRIKNDDTRFLRKLFIDDINLLEQSINKDLSTWK